MRTDPTDVTLLIDRSSSMRSIRQAAEDGVNRFLQAQRERPAMCW
ncbi:MAG: hypothetical protein RLZZ436_2759 [Planctomycetota bacterium]